MIPPVRGRRYQIATGGTVESQYGSDQNVANKTYKWQFRDHNPQCSQKVDGEIGQVVVGIMSAEKEEHDWYAEQKLLRRRILITIVNLLPHVEIIIGTGVEFKWNAPHPVEHDEGSEHVANIGEGP